MSAKEERTLTQFQIRALIRQEFQAGNIAAQATKNICDEYGAKTVTSTTVRKWYKKFETGDFSLGNKNSKHVNEIDPFSQVGINKFILCEVADSRMANGFKTFNGRLGVAFHKNQPDFPITLIDLLHGELRSIPIESLVDQPLNIHDFTFINSHQMLFYQFDRLTGNSTMFLMQLDEELTKCTVMDEQMVDKYLESIVVHQEDASKFALVLKQNNNYGIVFGKVQDEKICFENKFIPMTGQLRCIKFVDEKVCGLRAVTNKGQRTLYDYCEYDTNNGKLLKKFSLGDFIGPGAVVHFSWCDDMLFMLDELQKDVFLFGLDVEQKMWAKSDFKFSTAINCIAVNKDGFATVCIKSLSSALHIDGQTRYAIYRIPLKKPDSLRNIVFSSIRFSPQSTNNNLPLGTDLQCLFEDE